MKTCDKRGYSRSFSLTLVILPAVIGIIVLLIGSNIARAFDDLFSEFTTSYELLKVKTTDLRSLYQLVYNINGITAAFLCAAILAGCAGPGTSEVKEGSASETSQNSIS